MAHPLHHAESSVRCYGGTAADYQPIHDWFDATKAHITLPQHRALRHHTAGIFEAERFFGTAITTSSGRRVPVRWIGEQHVREDCRRILSVADWLAAIPMQAWMGNGVILGPEPDDIGDPRTAWVAAVTKGQTTTGLSDWLSHAQVV